MLPRIIHPAGHDGGFSNATVVARPLTRNDRNYTAPGGQFYTLSWTVVTRLVAIHAATPVLGLPEDTLIGRLLYDDGAEYEFVGLDDTRAFDVTDRLHRLSMEGGDLGRMDKKALNPHKMKVMCFI